MSEYVELHHLWGHVQAVFFVVPEFVSYEYAGRDVDDGYESDPLDFF